MAGLDFLTQLLGGGNNGQQQGGSFDINAAMSDPRVALGIGLLSTRTPQEGIAQGMGLLSKQSEVKRQQKMDELDKRYKEAQINKLGTLSGGGGGATGVLIDRYMADNPESSFSEALQAVQTGFRQNMLYKNGQLDAIPGAADVKRDFKYSEGIGSNRADLELKPTIAGATAESSAIGDASGKAQGTIEKRIIQAPQVEGYLKEAENLLPKATSGGADTLWRDTNAFFNNATEGSKFDSRLNILSASLTSGIPRMEGPQSDADRIMYKEAAGDLGNSKLPSETRLSAITTMRDLNNKYMQPAAVGGDNDMVSAFDPEGKPIRIPKSDLNSLIKDGGRLR